MSNLIRDNFNGTAGTNLSAHLADTGGAWTKHPVWNGDLALTGDGGAWPISTGTTAVYLASATPASADYSVSVRIKFKTTRTADQVGAVGRWDDTTVSGYAVAAVQSGGLFLSRFDNGSYTNLGGYNGTTSFSTDDEIELEFVGSSIRVYLNGILRIVVTDTTYSAAGRYGVLAFTSFEANGTQGFGLDYSEANDGRLVGLTSKYVCIAGDSLAWAYGASTGRGQTNGAGFGGQLLAALGAGWSGSNFAVPGWSFVDMTTNASTYNSTYDAGRTADIVIGEGGTNDCNDSAPDWTLIRDHWLTFFATLRAAVPSRPRLAMTVLAAALTSTVIVNPSGFNAAVANFNAWQRSNWAGSNNATMFVDIASDARCQDATSTYRTSDGLHWNDVLNAIIADLIANATLGNTASSIVTGSSTSEAVTVACRRSAAFAGTHAITITSSDPTDTITPSIGSPGTGSVTVTPTSGTTSFTYTVTRSGTTARTLTYTNNQGHTNPAATTFAAAVEILAPVVNGFSVSGSTVTFTLTNPAGNGTATLTVERDTGADEWEFVTLTPSSFTDGQTRTATVSQSAGTTRNYRFYAQVGGLGSDRTDPPTGPVTTAATLALSPTATPSPATAANTTLAANRTGGASPYTYSWTASTKPVGSNPAFSSAAVAGPIVTFDKAGDYTFALTVGSNDGQSVSASVSVTVSQTLTSIVLTPGTVTVANAGTQQFSANAHDQFGVSLTSQPTFTWSVNSGVGTINGTGLYSGGVTAGSGSVWATSGSVHGAAITTVSASTLAANASADPTTVTATTAALTVSITGGTSPYAVTWTTTTKPSGSSPAFSSTSSLTPTVTFNKAGSYVLQAAVTDSASHSVSATVNVTVSQTATSIVVSPSSPSLAAGTTQTFTAAARDQFAANLTSQPIFTWSKVSGVGSINSSTGVYSAGSTAGSAEVAAAAVSLTGSATITVTNSTPPDTTPPATPALSLSTAGRRWSWPASLATDFDHFEVSVDEDAAVDVGADLIYSAEDLTADEPHALRVRAVDDSGNASPWSASLTLAPDAGTRGYQSITEAGSRVSKAGLSVILTKWNTATDDQRADALAVAADRIDAAYRYQGRKADVSQERQFPRCDPGSGRRVTGSPTVPEDILRAQIFEADAILAGDRHTKNREGRAGLSGQANQGVSEQYATAYTASGAAGLLCIKADELVSRHRLRSGRLG